MPRALTKDPSIMTTKTAACATAVALLAGTAFFAGPAASREALTASSHTKVSSIHSRKLFLSAGAVYDAGLQRGSENSSRNAYLRGFNDGKSSEAYSSRRADTSWNHLRAVRSPRFPAIPHMIAMQSTPRRPADIHPMTVVPPPTAMPGNISTAATAAGPPQRSA